MQPVTTASVPPVTASERARAETEIKKMRKALVGWLRYRELNNAVAEGRAKAKVSPGLAKKMVETGRDWGLEQKLAAELHVLLSETFDAGQLPSPDVYQDPNAAVRLAQIAISGKLPGEAVAPGPQGLFWLWPAVVVVGLVLFTIVFKIRSDAETAQEKERIECIKMGACTDYGFWLKLGGVALLGWIVWDKFGGREFAGRARGRFQST
jgi:hypothetical protein